jgi:hypothetical protein
MRLEKTTGGAATYTLTLTPNVSVETGTFTLNYKISYTCLSTPADLANLSFDIYLVDCKKI